MVTLQYLIGKIPCRCGATAEPENIELDFSDALIGIVLLKGSDSVENKLWCLFDSGPDALRAYTGALRKVESSAVLLVPIPST